MKVAPVATLRSALRDNEEQLPAKPFSKIREIALDLRLYASGLNIALDIAVSELLVALENL